MSREEWLKKLDDKNEPIKHPELDAKIHKYIKDNGKVELVEGIFGDTEGCAGYIEETTDEGIKLFGCKYIYKGKIDNKTIDTVATVKRFLYSGIKLLSRKPYLLLFISKKDIVDYLADIYDADLVKKLPDKFCPAVQEFIRVGLRQLKGNEVKVLYCLAMFLQFDNAYRFRFQDGFSFSKNIKEVVKIMTEREGQLGKKWTILTKLIPFILFWERKFIKEFMDELDISKIRLDEADWYFCLRRRSYDFGGISYLERLGMAEEIDKEQGNTFLNL